MQAAICSQVKPAVVRIGNATFPFTGWAGVSAAYTATIDKLGLGGSQTPPCRILDGDGRQVAHVSYNGRVWEGDARDWQPGQGCLYDPMDGGRFPPRVVGGAGK